MAKIEMKNMEIPAGTVIMETGQKADGFYELMKGVIKITRADGEIIEVSKMPEGDRRFVGEGAFLIGGGKRTATVEAKTDISVVCFKGHRDDFFSSLKEIEGLARALMIDLARRVEEASGQVSRLTKERDDFRGQAIKLFGNTRIINAIRALLL